MPCIANSGTTPSPSDVDSGSSAAMTQCTNSGASRSTMVIATSTVPSGAGLQLSTGETLSPWHVWRGSMGPPSTNDDVTNSASVAGPRGVAVGGTVDAT